MVIYALATDSVFKRIWEVVKGKKNVLGYSGSYKKRIKDGTVIQKSQVVRVYVSKKEPLGKLKTQDVIPRIINDVEIDVVEIGEVKAQEEKNGILAIGLASISNQLPQHRSNQVFQQKTSSP